MAEHKQHKEEADASSSSSTSGVAGFVYEGGEFADDAPYVEEMHGIGVAGSSAAFGQDGSSSSGGAAPSSGGGGFGDLDTLLSSLLDGAEGDDGVGDDPDTCFSINAAASFAALVSPEEQIAEIGLQALDPEQAQAAVDVMTPLEIAQMILLLQQFRVPDEEAAASLPGPLRSIPLFFCAAAPLRARWFAAAEKQLRQGLAVFSIGINHEKVAASPAAAAAAPSTAASPSVYSLLFRGAKLTSPSLLDSIVGDLHSLIALPDVVQPMLLIKQLMGECASSAVEMLQDVSAMLNPNKTAPTAASASASAAAASPFDSPDPVATLISRLSSLRLSPDPSLPLTSPFTLDLGAGELRCPDFSASAMDAKTPEQLAQLREILGMKHEEAAVASSSSSSSTSASSASSRSVLGPLLPRLLCYLFVETSRAVWAELVAQVRDQLSLDVDAASIAASLEPSVLLLMALGVTPDSPLSSLLSADHPQASCPDEFFARWLPAAIETEVAELAAIESSSAEATARYLSLRTTAKQLAELTTQGLPSVPQMQRAILVELMDQ